MVSLKRHQLEEHGSPIASELPNIILGGQDGLVNVFGLAMGVAAGTGDAKAVIIAGLAGAFAESISMAAVAYTSVKTAGDYYESERLREIREMKEVPRIEKQEIREIYMRKGFKGKLLKDLVDHITSDKKLWLETMMTDELRLSKDQAKPLKSTAVVGISAMIGSMIPITPFFFMKPATAIPYVIVISTVALFITGVCKARLTTGKWWKSGLEIAVIGMIAALAGYAIGAMLGVVL